MSPDAETLRRLLEGAFLPTLSGGQDLDGFTYAPFEGAGWYRAYTVDVRFRDGAAHRLFLKDLGAPRGGKGDMVGRRERERCVYERLLQPERDGTARLYGVEWDPEGARYWLLLEYVEGTPVRQLDFETWRGAAAWLARFQAGFSAHTGRAARCDLVRHDEPFFLDVARGAVDAVTLWCRAAGARVLELLDGYDRHLSRLLEQPPTLVHGAFLPMQILAVGDDGGRLCPVDWELAGLGPPLYDLGFLAYGFKGAERRSLLAAYREEATQLGSAVPEDLSRRVACVEVHRTLAALGQSVERAYDDEAIGEYLDILEGLLARIGAEEVV
jgi:hypothetical protein